MNKIKVIDLLNMISKGENLPEKIRYDEKIWKLNPLNDTYDNGECCLFEDYIDKNYVITDVLNDEVEAIEEDKFEYIDQIHNDDDIPQRYNSKIKNTNLTFTDLDRITWYKVNELIDEVNELRKVIYNFKNVEELDIDLYSTEGGIRTAKKINEIIDYINKEEK